MEAMLAQWPLVIPTAAADRRQLLDLLFDWREAPDLLPGSTLQLGDRHFGNIRSPIMLTKLNAAEVTRRYGDAVLALPIDVPKAIRVRPVAFAKEHTQVINLVPMPGFTGLEKHSQVYRGTLGPSENVPLASTANDTADVIIKIYQTSRLDPYSWRMLSHDVVDEAALASNGLQDFEQEIWAYNQLFSLQGSAVPYVFGFFRVNLPHGEPCIALVEEHIPNIKQPDFSISFQGNEAAALRAVADNLSTAVLALHSCGVYQWDLAGRNVLLPIGNPTLPVLIDFADVSLARSVDPCIAVWRQAARRESSGVMLREICSILRTLVDLGFNKEAVNEWAKGKILQDKSWVVRFDVPTDDDSNYLNIMLFGNT